MAPVGSEGQTGGYRNPNAAGQQPNSSSGLGPSRHPPLPVSPGSPRNHNHNNYGHDHPGPTSSSFRTQRVEAPNAAGTGRDHCTSETGGRPGPDAAGGDEAAALAEYPYSIYNHGTWTAEDDKTLLQARSRGQNWAELQRTHFPNKTANACRKRYERLVERRGIHDYSGRRLEMVAKEYMNMRRELWSGLADRVGMKWEVVEALCMGAGLRTIQSNARSYTNRTRRDSRISQKMREAQAEALGTGSLGFALPALPLGSEFGTAFGTLLGDRNAGAAGIRSMPPPPLFPAATGPPPGNRLPPMILAPKSPPGAYADGGARPTPGPPGAAVSASEPRPAPRAPDW
ncbi:hypothetical protein MYCTH_2299736 [Thermothelomyces thermophilus ATCC 42464]|uniref:Myb-like domain-containing protein n=1 Tax=Thermothelomyces thermophilus (strain ATCC 42464 / BCRC 31852 / DSM 1799) TaxID=573729 RepID=G2PZI3_THET4|nr:uncharacterized protein MYCTH_2299736 [Thermothelomyces thermophilus ATCC 42464]AEO55669.1 hypothetical protein MYCTH_2299736 [Thermothelomyces thermophilus ATCC 42464]